MEAGRQIKSPRKKPRMSPPKVGTAKKKISVDEHVLTQKKKKTREFMNRTCGTLTKKKQKNGVWCMPRAKIS